ncbi:PilW family protein [Stenotrophomonas sp. NPDC077659]|uniref:PilW family protein n=1 Tax=Stenotrophomonas sp. NPDC077659 TaxID=3390694 RepID=UPI003D0935BF
MTAANMRGLTLVELLVATVLGVLVLGASLHFYLASLQGTQDTLGVARVQEAGRLAMELIGNDIRGAGDPLCDRRHAVTVLLAERQRPFWVSLAEPVQGLPAAALTGFEDPPLVTGNAPGQRLPDMPALRLWTTTALALATPGQSTSNQPIAVIGSDLPEVGAPVLVCDFSNTVLVRATTTGTAIGHAVPANCVDYFSMGEACPGQPVPPAARYRFGADAAFGLPRQVRWFVGNDEAGTPSLYRQELMDGEVVASGVVSGGVTHFSLRYLLDAQADYVPASQVSAAQWNQVHAVDVQLHLESSTGAAADAYIVRSFRQTFSLRNRLP